MPPKVLLLTDDAHLAALFRAATPTTAVVPTVADARERLTEAWAVVAASYPLPHADSLAWLAECRYRCPFAGRLLVVASPVPEVLTRAINAAQVTHVLVAPNSPEQVRAALQQTHAAAERDRIAGLEVALRALAEVMDAPAATPSHAERVLHYAWALGHALRLPEETLHALRLACWVHDVGKVAATGTPSDAASHPVYSAYWARRCGLPEEVQAAVRSHHERWDGAGFPDGLAGDQIPLLARLLAAADAYDHWTHRDKVPPADLAARLQQAAGTALDPQVVHALQALREPGDVFAALEGRDDLPVLAPVVQQALQLLMRDDFDWQEVAEVLARDERLAAHLLRLANSAITGFRRRITNLPTALRVLGARAVCNLLLTLSVQPLLRASAEYEVWRHSLGCALLARAIAQRTRQVDPDEAFAAGLLHDIGKTLLWRYFPEGAQRARTIAQRQGCPLFLAERLVFGTSHAEVGGWLLERWRLPSPLPEAVAHHHAPPPEGLPLAWHVHWADALWHQGAHQFAALPHWTALPLAPEWRAVLTEAPALVAEARRQVEEVERLVGV